MNQFIVRVKYTKQLENGSFKRVSEPYLLFAYTFTDAEARIYEELGSIIRGEFIIGGISRADFHDIFINEDCDTFFRCKVSYVTQDADSEKSKRVSQNFLVSAISVKQATERITECLKGLMVEWKLTSVMASPIVEVFPMKDAELKNKEISRKPLAEFDNSGQSDETMEVEFENDSLD